jgi:hypothetical protein
MKNIYEVLRQKELQISQLAKEVEALRIVAPLLSEGMENTTAADAPRAQGRPTGTEGTAHRWP